MNVVIILSTLPSAAQFRDPEKTVPARDAHEAVGAQSTRVPPVDHLEARITGVPPVIITATQATQATCTMLACRLTAK